MRSELLRLLGHSAGLRNPHIPALYAVGAATEAGASGKQGTLPWVLGARRDPSGTSEGCAGFRLEPGGTPVGPRQDPGGTQVEPRPSPGGTSSA